jgi:hypothetical protein
MSVLLACGAVGLLLGGGAGLRALLRAGPEDAIGALASSAVLGLASCGLIGPIAAAAGLPVPQSAAAALAALSLAGLPRLVRSRPRREELPVALAIAPLLALVAFRAFTLPMSFGDEVAVWGYKAAAIVATGTIEPAAWSLSESRGPSYPLALPVAGTLASIPLSRFDAAGCRAVAVLGYGAFAASAASLLRRRLRGIDALAATLAVAALPSALLEGSLFMADLVFTAAVALAAGAILRGLDPRALGQLAALPLLRPEGLPIALLLAVVGWAGATAGRADRANRSRPLLLVVALALPLLPWILVPASRPSFPGPLETLGRLPEVALALSTSAVAPREFGLLVPALLLLVLGSRKRGSGVGALALALAAAVVAGQAVSLAAAPNFEWQLKVVGERAAIHLVPAWLLAADAFLDRRGSLF